MPSKALLALLLGASPMLQAKEPPASAVSFQKIQLLDKYHAEGATIADLNADGHPDILAGSMYWLGPDFQQHYAYEPVQYWPIKGKGYSAYSDVFFTFTDNFDGDKWTDILQLSYQRKPAKVYLNPGEHPYAPSADTPACPHTIAENKICNESPTYVNIVGDKQRELLSWVSNALTITSRGKNAQEKWISTPLSPPDKTKYGRGHGLGTGDVNGDGRIDVIDRFGWWEQPESWNSKDSWTFHPVNFATLAPHQGGAQMFAYDVDGDGDNDVVTALNAHAYGLAWFENTDGSGEQFIYHLIMGDSPADNPYGVCFSQLHAMDCTDIDGDGVNDIITGKCYFAHKGSDPGAEDPAVLYWFKTDRKENGEVEFIPYLIDSDSGVGRQITTGDLNGDGKPDLVTANKKGVFAFIQE